MSTKFYCSGTFDTGPQDVQHLIVYEAAHFDFAADGPERTPEDAKRAAVLRIQKFAESRSIDLEDRMQNEAWIGRVMRAPILVRQVRRLPR